MSRDNPICSERIVLFLRSDLAKRELFVFLFSFSLSFPLSFSFIFTFIFIFTHFHSCSLSFSFSLSFSLFINLYILNRPAPPDLFRTAFFGLSPPPPAETCFFQGFKKYLDSKTKQNFSFLPLKAYYHVPPCHSFHLIQRWI